MSFRDGKAHTAERTLSTETGVLHFEVTTSPLRDPDGNIIAGIEVARDVTYRKKMEKEILKADKLESLGILAGGIAHDFNNLLTAIIGNISVAGLYASKDGKIHRRLAEAERASIRAKDLTQQLLTFSRGGEPVKRKTRINDLLRETAGFALRGSRNRCEFFIPPDLWPVEADEGQISQVINNLLINADQAMPGGGTISMRSENVLLGAGHGMPLGPGRHLKISIEDHGVGIPCEYLTKIFDPFFTTKNKGSGLGLATAYAIIKKHCGHIEVESAPGLKTTFSVYLPACGEGGLAVPVEKAVPRPGSGRILVMDDEPSVREVTCQMLTTVGYDVELAADGALAVELYRKAMDTGSPFDAVIMDLTVPGGMGGMEALGKLRKLDPGIRAVITSGYSNDPVIADSRKHGFMGVVAKPYKLEDLSQALHEILAP
jgi:signal transduction histidine kinase/ActR/RegA family two-component response regulator